jgi:hypothetical protein
MVEWSILVVEEYEYLVKAKSVAQMGMSDFQVLPSFLKDRLKWKDNFSVLAGRLTNASGVSKAPMWFDIYALQMLFSQHDHPVFISPVYGCLMKQQEEDLKAYPHVPSLVRVQWFPGLRDLEPNDYPSSFTVVPILALDTVTFGQMSYSGGIDSCLQHCKALIAFESESVENLKSF